MVCVNESSTKFSAKAHVMFKKIIKTRRNFRKAFEKEQVREAGGVHEDEFETLGVVRGINTHEGTGELVDVDVCLDVADSPDCCSSGCLGELTGDSSSFRLCGRSCLVCR